MSEINKQFNITENTQVKTNQVNFLYQNDAYLRELPRELLTFLLSKQDSSIETKTTAFQRRNPKLRIFQGDLLYQSYRVSFVKKINTPDLIKNFPYQSKNQQVPKLVSVIENNSFSQQHNLAVFKVPYKNPKKNDHLAIYSCDKDNGFDQDLESDFGVQKAALEQESIIHPGLNDPTQRVFDEDDNGRFYLDSPTLFRKNSLIHP
jgi:hypothetical protein